MRDFHSVVFSITSESIPTILNPFGWYSAYYFLTASSGLDSSNIHTRLHLKNVKGSHDIVYKCTYTDGPYQWPYTAHNEPNNPVQTSAQAFINTLRTIVKKG
jgi:hypothetical protein